ncbi:MAG TPA: envelope stress response membrane protein PspC [Gammaproteobacteria bacterium]|jgi:phage shock protein C|nr:envelope stress response membrane protein PspC [Gammaproteobacteria bacterium]
MKGDGAPAGVNRLYRIPRRGVIFGVCAGLADYFGFDVTVTRVIVVLGAMFSAPLVIVAYVVLGFLLPARAYGDREADPVQAQLRSNPHSSLSSVRYRFRDLDVRLQRLEKYVTSSRYKLDREFQQLK